MLVALAETNDDSAQAAQVGEIARLDPADNLILFPDETDAPF